jgi:hypothetical protein
LARLRKILSDVGLRLHNKSSDQGVHKPKHKPNVCSMTFLCNHCRSLNFESEKTTRGIFSHCCHNGTVTVPEQLFPEMLQDLLGNPANVDYKHFHDQIRQYNASLAFASMNAKTITLPGVYVYKVHGQIYHSIGNMHPEVGIARQNSQFYIIDTIQNH